MRGIQWVFISLLVTSCAAPNKSAPSASQSTPSTSTSVVSSKSFSVSSKAFTPVPFIAHSEAKPMKSYIAMNLPYPVFSDARKDLEKHLGQSLLHRDEAHITVITPPEYDKVLKKRIGIQELNSLAEKRNLQQTAFKISCVGKGNGQVDGATHSTYYLVVDSEGLLAYRKEVQKLYISRGGRALDFNPDLFFPHVTLGFTKRDLHLEDGVTKDANSCILPVSMK